MPLTLQRHVGERIVIGDDIVIVVAGVTGVQVRLGFQAPAEVSIDREEIWLRKRGEQVIRLELDSTETERLTD